MQQPGLANRVMYDGLYTFVMRLLNVGCAAGLGILTARMLGPAGKGIYALPGIDAGLVVSGFSGLGSALSYFLLNRRPGKAILWPAFVSACIFVSVGALAVVAIAYAGGQLWAAVPALLSLPAAAAVNFASGYAIGIKRVRYSTTITVALTLLTFALMAAGLLILGRTPVVAIAAWILANAAIGVACLAGVAWHASRLRGTERIGTTEFLRFSTKVGFVNLIALLNYRADLYIVALLTSPAAVGMYTVGISAAESLLVPTQVAALVTSPHIASLERDAAARLAARCVRNNFLIAVILCGLISAFAGPIVHLLYGAAFAPVVPAMQILLLGVLALSLGSPLSSFFTLKLGRPEVALWLAGASAAVCIGVSLVLVPRLGMIGAAIGSTAAYASGQAAAMWYFRRCTNIGIRTLLLPTLEDLNVYRSFADRVLADGRQFLRAGSVR